MSKSSLPWWLGCAGCLGNSVLGDNSSDREIVVCHFFRCKCRLSRLRFLNIWWCHEMQFSYLKFQIWTLLIDESYYKNLENLGDDLHFRSIRGRFYQYNDTKTRCCIALLKWCVLRDSPWECLWKKMSFLVPILVPSICK